MSTTILSETALAKSRKNTVKPKMLSSYGGLVSKALVLQLLCSSEGVAHIRRCQHLEFLCAATSLYIRNRKPLYTECVCLCEMK